ncbi:MAG: hypothetical protein DCC55_19740 [Chloroflexi bacterium]|nr:MAG: hypothetical protein DCC55_19740 [Chloroflexota bacterium]
MLSIQTLNPLNATTFGETRHRRRVEQTVRRTYASWRARFPRWANSGFDDYFLLHDALPLLDEMLADGRYLDPAQIVHKWAQVYRLTDEGTRRALVEATPVAADFLTRLQIEYASAKPA